MKIEVRDSFTRLVGNASLVQNSTTPYTVEFLFTHAGGVLRLLSDQGYRGGVVYDGGRYGVLAFMVAYAAMFGYDKLIKAIGKAGKP